MRNGCDGCDGDGGGGARGSAVCGRGLTPAARPDGSGGATRQQPPAPPPPQAVAGRQWCLSRGDAEAGRAEAGRAEAGRAETGRAEAGRADAGRPNGDAAFRRTAEVGRGLVGGCGSWSRPCGCRSGLQAWIQYDYRLETYMVAGWSHVVTGWVRLRLRAVSTSALTRALCGRRFALSASRRAIVSSPRRSALIPEPACVNARPCTRTRTRGGICSQCARAHEPPALIDKLVERSRKICSCAWRSRRSLRRHVAAAAAATIASVTAGIAIGTGKSADTDSFFTQALASSLHIGKTSTAAAAPAASASRAATVAIASSIAASSTSVCEVAQVIDSAAFSSFSLRSMLAAGGSHWGAPTENSIQHAARPGAEQQQDSTREVGFGQPSAGGEADRHGTH